MPQKATEIISSEPDSLRTYLCKIWDYRLLILSFAKRDIQTKYAQTVLGLAWTLLQPVTGIFIFTLFFNYILQIKLDGISYPVFALIGFSAWNLWSSIFQQGSIAIFEQRTLLSKVYFPKIILPISKVLTGSFDFLIMLLLLIVLIPIYDIDLTWRMILLPLFYFIQITFALSCAIILSVLSLKKRDFFHIIPYILNFGIWATPVFYSISLFPEKWRFAFQYNPIALCIEGYRWCIFSNYIFDKNLFISILIVMLLAISAVVLIKKTETKFVDQL